MLVAEKILLKQFGTAEYQSTVEAMREFTARRTPATPDELWLLEHPPVYTLGLAADVAHGPQHENGIPVVQVERGGEITYHGPGQVVLYTLVDLARRGIKVKQFVALLEQSVIDLLGSLAERGVERAQRVAGAPGVYVGGAKIAALGIRVSRGCTYHGLALNVEMDLTPFSAIHPCGYPGLRVTQTRDLGIKENLEVLGKKLAGIVIQRLEHA
ncbi:MAG: lipoyl(octanoyl) transferase LipB [Betaproteobacteria bacterium]|nr:lipoyl(octanoyl) transferase LipB [Betaproteobacteria bacterium]MSQ89186.1 lipoyl(octanoyl) transferase LipB [Betaproteobacteria bacterium]